jgi:hypothetical protein
LKTQQQRFGEFRYEQATENARKVHFQVPRPEDLRNTEDSAKINLSGFQSRAAEVADGEDGETSAPAIEDLANQLENEVTIRSQAGRRKADSGTFSKTILNTSVQVPFLHLFRSLNPALQMEVLGQLSVTRTAVRLSELRIFYIFI